MQKRTRFRLAKSHSARKSKLHATYFYTITTWCVRGEYFNQNKLRKINRKHPTFSILGAKFTLPVSVDFKVIIDIVVVKFFSVFFGRLFTAVCYENPIFTFERPSFQFCALETEFSSSAI